MNCAEVSNYAGALKAVTVKLIEKALILTLFGAHFDKI